MTDPSTEHAPDPSPRGQDDAFAALRQRFPKATDATIFSIHKLEQDPNLSMRDIRDEARLHGLTLSGRAFHSAKVFLGLAEPATRRSSKPDAPAPKTAPAKAERRASNSPSHDVESSLLDAVQKIQDAATADSRRLREAMRQAVEILQRALDGRA